MSFSEWFLNKIANYLDAVFQSASISLINVMLFGVSLYLCLLIRNQMRTGVSQQTESPAKNDSAPATTTKANLLAAQLKAAQAQIQAAEAQVAASQMLTRPLVLPALEYDLQRARFDLVLRNVGLGIGFRAAWSISPAFQANLDRFIWPKEARLIPLQRGLVSTPLIREGDWFKTMPLIPEGDYLVLVNYLDVHGNLWQSQLLTNLGKEDAVGEQGFGVIMAPELQRYRSLLQNPSDPMESGLHPWWIPKKPSPERRRPHIV